ncbi:O-antigen ligase family protein [Psychroflexus sp. CAK8W]|uniref:O-antigen ligase family protein n=1 Tax=Psychroflexus longus TaxID=2873596 RepID=A0ABS7XJ68_9FLAO|nr:O-antigen ligase family protein [Psychroflexus longus]MBZ9777936.1 O-antigen ligase family protein [Psychroflexus longus]
MYKQMRIVNIVNSYTLLFLVCFTLPMYTQINNLLLGIFIVFSIFNYLKDRENFSNSFFKNYFPVIAFFFLAVIASLNYDDILNFKELEKYWSFLLIPLAFWMTGGENKKLIKYAFRGLILGCVTTLLICYLNTFYEIIAYNEPWSYIFRWRHLSHRFTEIADTHPAYLGLFICTSTYYLLFKSKQFNTKLRILILSIYFLGMLQLASRVAIFIFILIFFGCIFSIFKKNIKYFIVSLIIFLFSSLIIFSVGSEYLNKRMLSIENIMEDSRFDRLNISYKIFKENILLGTGFEKVDEVRIKKYREYDFDLAAREKYNAHNQFFEYLTINGIVGGIIYAVVLFYLILLSLKRKNHLFLFIIISFFVANLTESMLVRIKGVEYFSIFVSLFLMKTNPKKENLHK